MSFYVPGLATAATGSVADANIAPDAEIQVSKLADGIARQLLQTDAAGTGVEWTSNVDLPGTLDVTGAATFDSAVTVPLGTAGAPALRPVGSSTTGIFYPDTSTVAVSTGGSERMRVDSSGKMLIGTGTVRGDRLLQIEGDSAVAGVFIRRDALASALSGAGSYLGRVSFGNTEGYIGAEIRVENDAAWSAGSSYPSAFVVSTTTSGASSPTEKMKVASSGNVKIGGTANRGTTEGTNQLVLFNGTAPVGTLANGISLYSASGECRVMDAAGNSTLLSPHDRETNEWIYDSTDTTTGKRLRIDMEKMMKFLDAHFGLGYVQETFTT